MDKEHSEGTKKLYPNEMSSRHRSVMRMEIAGHTTNDIAKELGFNVQRLSLIMNSPLYIGERTEKAARTLVGALDAGGSVGVSAAKDILDRGGYAKEEKIRANVFVEPSQSLLDMLNRVGGKVSGTDKSDGSGEDSEPASG